MKNITTRGYGLDITPNSQDYLKEKCTDMLLVMLLVMRINFQVLGVKGLTLATENSNPCQRSNPDWLGH